MTLEQAIAIIRRVYPQYPDKDTTEADWINLSHAQAICASEYVRLVNEKVITSNVTNTTTVRDSLASSTKE